MPRLTVQPHTIVTGLRWSAARQAHARAHKLRFGCLSEYLNARCGLVRSVERVRRGRAFLLVGVHKTTDTTRKHTNCQVMGVGSCPVTLKKHPQPAQKAAPSEPPQPRFRTGANYLTRLARRPSVSGLTPPATDQQPRRPVRTRRYNITACTADLLGTPRTGRHPLTSPATLSVTLSSDDATTLHHLIQRDIAAVTAGDLTVLSRLSMNTAALAAHFHTLQATIPTSTPAPIHPIPAQRTAPETSIFHDADGQAGFDFDEPAAPPAPSITNRTPLTSTPALSVLAQPNLNIAPTSGSTASAPTALTAPNNLSRAPWGAGTPGTASPAPAHPLQSPALNALPLAPTSATHPITATHSVEDARTWVRTQLMTGAPCPCCDQLARISKRSLTHSMIRVLLTMLRTAGTEFTSLPALKAKMTAAGEKDLGRDEAMLAYWGLIEEATTKRPDGGRRGYWRVTDIGAQFARNQIALPSTVYTYNGIAQAPTGPLEV